MKSVLWRVAKRLTYIEDARCLKVKKVTFKVEPSIPLNKEVYNSVFVSAEKF